MKVFIKDMVCVRCKMAVKTVLEELGIKYLKVELGYAVLDRTLTNEELEALQSSLRRFELSLISDRKKIITERIKNLVIELLNNRNQHAPVKLSAYLSRHMDYDYTYMANVFSQVEGYTIERFFVESRIDKAKQLMFYEGMRAKEAAYELHFSSVSHFSLQFKKVTGYTPAEFKKECESDDFVFIPLRIANNEK